MARSKAKKAKKRTASGQRAIIIVSGKNKKGRPGSFRMLNPQPLPPKQKASRKKKPGSSRMLNPQPLPPKQKASRKKKKSR